MGVSVDSAIVALWDANSLDAVFAGGLWDTEAPPRTPFPYVVFSQVSDMADVFTSGGIKNSRRGKIMELLFQMDIFLKENGIDDPKQQMGQYMGMLRPILENAQQMPLANGFQILLRHVSDLVIRESSGIYHGVLTFKFRQKIDVAGSRL